MSGQLACRDLCVVDVWTMHLIRRLQDLLSVDERSTGVQLPVCCPRSDMHFNLGMQGVLSIESRTTYSSACLLYQLREIDAANLESRLQPTNRTDIDNTVDRVSSPSILFPSPTLNGRSAERRRNLSTTFPL